MSGVIAVNAAPQEQHEVDRARSVTAINALARSDADLPERQPERVRFAEVLSRSAL